MSNLILSQAYQVKGITPSQKAVLCSLADQANDDGICWPSIATTVMRTNLSERTVIRALSDLISIGALQKKTRFQNNTQKSNMYLVCVDGLEKHDFNAAKKATLEEFASDTVSPPLCHDDTPPLTQCHPPSDTVTPRTIIEPKENPKGINKARTQSVACTVPKPDEVTQQVWDDFLQTRKAKRSPLTKTALDAIEREAMKAGFSLQDALRECTARGWQGFKADWVTKPIKPGQPTEDDRKQRTARVYEKLFGEPMQAREA